MPPDRYFCDAGDGTRLAYQAYGPEGAPAVMLVHAIGLDGSMWEAQRDALATAYRVIVPDLRGHGTSAVSDGPFGIADLADDLHRVVTHSGVDAVRYVGCSMGANIGMFMAARPEYGLSGVVLANGAARLAVPDDVVASLCAAARDGAMPMIAADMVARWVTPESATAPATARLVETLAACSGNAFAAAFEALARSDRTPDLGAIAVPALVLAGSADAAFDATAAHATAGAIPGATVVVVPDAGHLPNVERPDAFNHALLGFLAGLAS